MVHMWMVKPVCLCNRHLGGEHVETHMLLGCVKHNKWAQIEGHVKRNQVELHSLQKRHNELAEEMLRRGYNHKSPMEFKWNKPLGKVDVNESIRTLCGRCPECKKRIEDGMRKRNTM